VKNAYANNHRRVSTSLVNQVLLDAYGMSPPPAIKGKRLKLKYATQVSATPPTFVLFVNDTKMLKPTYTRYLEKKLRESFEFSGTPIVIKAKSGGEN
jgi:GTP-binding protein